MADPMNSDWYYLKRGAPPDQQVGPLDWEQLYVRARAREVAPDDLVWNPQFPAWVAAAQIPSLFPVSTAAQPAQRRRFRLLPVLIPLAALLVVGAALGAYFGFTRDGGGEATGQRAGIGTIEIKLPDESKLVETEAWGLVPANQIGVILADGKDRADAEKVARALDGTVVGELELVKLYQIETGGASEVDLAAALDQAEAISEVELAFPNQTGFLKKEIWGVRQSPLNDPAYGGDYGKSYELIGVQKAWIIIRGCGLELSPVKVGIVDDGLYKGTGEFDGQSGTEYPDPAAGELTKPDQVKKVGGGTVPDPKGSHGTAIAGIIGADPDNGGQTGIASTALGDNLTMSVINAYGGRYGYTKVEPDPDDPTQFVSSSGSAYSIGYLAAMLKQVEAGAKVVNCSFGANEPGEGHALLAKAYRKFFETMAKDKKYRDVIFVCAAGNEAGALSKTNYWPAGAGSDLPNVITVGNVMNNGRIWKTSNFAGPGGEVTLAAPGHEAIQGVDENGVPITNEYLIGGYLHGGGTSCAAPMVSAAAALLLSVKPDLTAARVKEILAETARPGPERMGGILAVDEAVFQLVTEVRKEKDLPALTRAQLEAMGAIDAVAVSTDEPNTYTITGILEAVPDNGTAVAVSCSEGCALGGVSPQRLDKAGEVTWSARVVVDGPVATPTVTVTRTDNGACSVITLEPFDVEGDGSRVIPTEPGFKRTDSIEAYDPSTPSDIRAFVTVTRSYTWEEERRVSVAVFEYLYRRGEYSKSPSRRIFFTDVPDSGAGGAAVADALARASQEIQKIMEEERLLQIWPGEEPWGSSASRTAYRRG